MTLLDRYRVKVTPERPTRARHNLPAITHDYIERPAEAKRIVEGLELAYPVSIEGFGGMGKSTLAIWVAERCLPGSGVLVSMPFDFIVWISAKDYPNFDMSLNDLLNTIAERIGYTGLLDLPFNKKLAEVNELLHAQRVLVVVDNMETVSDKAIFEFLRRVRGQSRVLITTRHKQFRSVWEVTVEGLEVSDALKKIRHEVRSKDLRVLANASDDVLLPLVKMTEGNPKAIELTLGYVKRTGIPLDEAVRTLDEAVEDVEGLFPYLFERDWQSLDEAPRRVLLAMPLFSGEARRDALQTTSAVHKHAFKSASEELVELSLLDVSTPSMDGEPRYVVHPLTRAFARAQLKATGDLESEFRARWVDWCVRFAETNGATWQTYDLLEAEKATLIECIEWCHQSRLWPPVITFAESLTSFFNVRGHWEARQKAVNLFLQAAEESGNDLLYARMIQRAVSPAMEQLGRDEQREQLVLKALRIFEQQGDEQGVAVTHFVLGLINYRLRGYSAARPLLEQCVHECEGLGDEIGLGRVLNYLGSICVREGLIDEGKRFLERAWACRSKQDSPHRQGGVLRNLGRLEFQLGHLARAEELLVEALRLFDLEKHQLHLATAKHDLACVKQMQGQINDASQLLEHARSIYLQVGAWARTAEVVSDLYRLELRRGNVGTAQALVIDMIDRYRRLEMPKEVETMEMLLTNGNSKFRGQHG